VVTVTLPGPDRDDRCMAVVLVMALAPRAGDEAGVPAGASVVGANGDKDSAGWDTARPWEEGMHRDMIDPTPWTRQRSLICSKLMPMP